MSKRVSFRASGLLIPILLISAGVAVAQTLEWGAAQNPRQAAAQNPEQEKAGARKPSRRPTPSGRVTVVPSQLPVAPQVVTVIHRLSGVKVLRFLFRQAGQNGVVETFDRETVNNDAHASIIAGWALDDGKTIAARLPQAAAEIDIKDFEGPFADHKSPLLATAPFSFLRPSAEPDLTVVTLDGRKLRARLIGLDAETGLSIMQVTGTVTTLPQPAPTVALAQGQSLEIFAPEPVKPESEAPNFNTFVRIGKTDATISKVNQENLGSFEKLIAQGTLLSPNSIGGVACDSSGNTVGIVESIANGDASIVSASTIRTAAQRVLERKASVPRPVLGVRGEFVQTAQRAEFLAHGWREEQLDDLFKAHMGILLLSVMPKTPAALARLQAGDIIMRVNENEIKSGEQFSKLLGQAGSGEKVVFTIKRPGGSQSFSVPVTLGGSFAPLFEWQWHVEMASVKPVGLQVFGIESMALAEGGLIVVAVRPESAAAQADVREGDVIESINGKIANRGMWAVSPNFVHQKKYTLALMRGREKKRVVVEITD